MKRFGGKIKSYMKAVFTVMVTCDLESRKIATPFVVYNGTKLKDARNKTTTLDWKFRNLRDLSNRCTAHMAFQKKHWFDDDITID